MIFRRWRTRPGSRTAQFSGISLCRSRTIPGGGSATYESRGIFPIEPRRAAAESAKRGEENTIIGNWYSVRFRDAWDAAEYVADHLEKLEHKTRLFAASLGRKHSSSGCQGGSIGKFIHPRDDHLLPYGRWRFDGFEGVDHKLGCCFGNCTHVWNYETTTAHLFPVSRARSAKRHSASAWMKRVPCTFVNFYLMVKNEAASLQPDGTGDIVHAYLDWKLSGNRVW